MSAHAPGAHGRLGSFDAHRVNRDYVIESLPRENNAKLSLGIDDQYPGFALIN